MGASGDKREERNIIISEPQMFKKNSFRGRKK